MNRLTLQTRLLARNVSWLLLQEVLIRFIGLATAIYLARVLGASGYGMLGLALALIAVLTNIVEAGTGSRATRLTALDPDSVPDTYAQISGLRLFIALVLILLLIVSAPALSRVFSFPSMLLVLCSLLLLRPAFAVMWAFRGLDRMHVIAIAGVMEKLVVLVGLIVLVRGRADDILWVPVVEVCAAILMVYWLRVSLGRLYPDLGIAFRWRDWPEISRESLPLGLAAVLGSLYLHGAVLLLGWLHSPEAAAQFLVAQKIMLTMALLLYVMSRSAFPSTIRSLALDPSSALALVANLLRYYLLLIIPLVLLLAWYASDVIALLFAADYAHSASVLIPLLAALPLLAVSHNLQMLLRAIPRPGAVLRSRILTTLALLLLAVFLIPDFGAGGAALAVLLSEAAGVVLLLVLVKQALGAVPLNARCAVPVLAGLAAALTFLLISDWSLPVGLTLSGAVYLLVVFSTKALSFDELKSMPQLVMAVVTREDDSKILDDTKTS